jgi:hypothetical protein
VFAGNATGNFPVMPAPTPCDIHGERTFDHLIAAVVGAAGRITTMVNTANWDKFSKRIILGLLMAAVVAACFLLLGIYIVGAGI